MTLELSDFDLKNLCYALERDIIRLESHGPKGDVVRMANITLLAELRGIIRQGEQPKQLIQ